MSNDVGEYYTEQYVVEVKRLKTTKKPVCATWREISAPYGMNHCPIGPSLIIWDKETGSKEYEVDTDEHGRRTMKRTFNLKTGKVKKVKDYLRDDADTPAGPEPV